MGAGFEMTAWCSTHLPFLLSPDTVAVWHVALDVTDDCEQRFFVQLDASEQQRAKRFYRRHDQKHFTVARGVLRHLLAKYLQISPEVIQFDYLAQGKPVLLDRSLQFNVSHSHGQALFAFARQGRIGIDLEQEDRDVEWASLSQRFFARAEHQAILALPASEQKAAFFRCWTRKEAYVKAHGDGLMRGLQSFEVSVGEEAKLVADHDAPGEVASWQMQAISLPNIPFKAAVVVERCQAQPLKFQYRCCQPAYLLV